MKPKLNIRSRAGAAGLVLAMALLFPPPAGAGMNRWTRRGLEGRPVDSLAVDPSNPSRMYASSVGSLFRTADGGESWAEVNIRAQMGSISSLTIDAQAPDTLYAVGLGGIFRSRDRGDTWTQTSMRYAPYTMSVDPTREGRIYAGRDHAVSYSRDGGATWSSSEIPYSCSFVCTAAVGTLALDLASPSTIYAGVNADYDYPGPDALFKSTDAGATWSASDAGLADWSSVYALAVDPSDSARVLAGTSAGIYLSRDAGRNWSATSPFLIGSILFDPRNPSVVYATSYNDGVFRSTDRGVNWSLHDPGLSDLYVQALVIDRTGRFLHAATLNGVFSYEVAATLDLFGGSDGTTGFFSFEPVSGGVLLGTVDDSGRKVLLSSFGPYAGWSPEAGASGSDGVTRVLWNNEDGSAALWLTRPEGVRGSFLYHARPGWTARDVAAGTDGATHILWTAADGAMALWTVDGSGARTGSLDYGPYSGWSAAAIADGSDGRTRVLWKKTDGTAGLSLFDAGGLRDTHRYAPIPGFTAIDLAVGNDDRTRVLWAHEDGRVVLWTIGTDGEQVTYGPVYPSPSGFRAARVSAGSDGLNRLLWTHPNGMAIVWILSPEGLYQDSFPLN